MQTIILGVVMFIVVVVALIMVLLAAKSKLVSSAEVVIDINEGEKVLKTPAGSTLLDILSTTSSSFHPLAAAKAAAVYARFTSTKVAGVCFQLKPATLAAVRPKKAVAWRARLKLKVTCTSSLSLKSSVFVSGPAR